MFLLGIALCNLYSSLFPIVFSFRKKEGKQVALFLFAHHTCDCVVGSGIMKKKERARKKYCKASANSAARNAALLLLQTSAFLAHLP